MASIVRLSRRRGKVEAIGVQAIPKFFKDGTRERLFQVELGDLAIARNAEFVWVGICNCLDIEPPPGPAVAAVRRNIINPVVLQAKGAVARYPNNCKSRPIQIPHY